MASTPLQQLNEHGQSVWIDYLSRDVRRGRRPRRPGRRGRPRRHLEPDDLPGRDRRGRRLRRAAHARCSRPRREPKEIFLALAVRDIQAACDVLQPKSDDSGARRLGLARGRPEPRPRHAGHDRRGQAPARSSSTAQPVREDPRHEGGPAGDRGDDRQRHPDQRDADLLARAPPRGGRGLRPRRQATGRERRRPDARSRRSPRSSSRASTPRPTSGSTRSAATTSSRASWRSPTPSSPTRPTRSSSRAPSGRRWPPRARPRSAACGRRPRPRTPTTATSLYVEELIGPDTVNTMPRETIEAFQDHGEVARHDREGRRRRAQAAARTSRRRASTTTTSSRCSSARASRSSPSPSRSCSPTSSPSATGWWRHERRRRELGQQLRVDSVRSSAAANSGHPTSSMSAADLMAVLIDEAPPPRLPEPGQPEQRPPDLLQGPRVAAVLRDAQGRGGDRRRGAAHVPQARLAARGPPDAAHPADRRGHRLARPGPADRGRRRAGGQAARPPAVPRLVPVRRLRDGRGLDVGGVRARRLRRASTT